ncbi:MAG TPA: SpoIID/LytB domain-containing protein, partial [Spirochaetota bacterium]|nr:SpoIID/LytB domain-containing protein [Spirochaetota bacterium]
MRKVFIAAILMWCIGDCMENADAAGPEIPRSVRVSILSNHQVSEVVVRAEGGLFGVSDASQCDGRRMTFMLKNGNVEVVWSGGKTRTSFAVIRSDTIELTFAKNGKRERRIYRGEVEISPAKGELLIINETLLECYVHESAVAELGELPSKLNVSARRELLASMEIVIRSYLVSEARRHEGGYQFCDLTHCVHFPGVTDGGASLSAGVLLLDGSK